MEFFSNRNYGPLTSTLLGLSRNRKKKGKTAGGEQPAEKVLGPDVAPDVLNSGTNDSILEPKITAGLNAPPAAPAPTGVPLQRPSALSVPMGTGYWGGNVPQSSTGPTEERLINNMVKDPFRTQLLRHEGSARVEGADKETGPHRIYRDADGWATGYGHQVTPEDFAAWGLDPNDEKAIQNFKVSDEWARETFAKDSAHAYQKGAEFLAELGLSASGPLADIIGNMTYQMGPQGVRGFRKMGEALKRGDTKRAAQEMLNSKWAQQTPSRAQELAKQMQSLGPLKTGLSS